jgi:small subunit ribosomal protein S4
VATARRNRDGCKRFALGWEQVFDLLRFKVRSLATHPDYFFGWVGVLESIKFLFSCMQIGPRYKICKRLGSGVFEKCQTQKFETSKSRGDDGGRRRRQSNYGAQLEEKQRVRYSYGIREGQFKNYIDEAVSQRDKRPADALYETLEMRLDNVVYRLGFGKTRAMSRQLVNHGHIFVNGTRVDIPSYTVSDGDTVHVRKESQDKVPFQIAKEGKEGYEAYTPPAWLTVDRENLSGDIKAQPNHDPTAEIFDLTSVIEFYSR